MDQVERVREEGRKAFESLLNDYSEEELLNSEQLLDKWQVLELREQCRRAWLACEMATPDDERCSKCDSIITGRDSPFCCACGAKNTNFDPARFPNMETRIAEECAQGHPSPLVEEEDGELTPMDYYCYLCGAQLESASALLDPPL